MPQSPRKEFNTAKDKSFAANFPHDGFNRVIDEVLDTMDNSIRDVVATLDLSIFGQNIDIDTAMQGLQPMIVSMQDSLIDVIGALEYEDYNVPRDWLRHQYGKDPIPNDALGHFAGIEDTRQAMENLADRIKQQMSMMDMDDMDPQKKASIKLSIGFISGMIDKILDRVNGLDNKAGFEELKNKFGNARKTPSFNARRRQPQLPPPPRT